MGVWLQLFLPLAFHVGTWKGCEVCSISLKVFYVGMLKGKSHVRAMLGTNVISPLPIMFLLTEVVET